MRSTIWWLFADAISANRKLFADIVVPIEEKHIKGGGVLYGGYLQMMYLQIKLFAVVAVPIEKKTRKGRRSTIWLFIIVDLLP